MPVMAGLINVVVAKRRSSKSLERRGKDREGRKNGDLLILLSQGRLMCLQGSDRGG